MEFRERQIAINAVQESEPCRERGDGADDSFILLKFSLYKYIGFRPSPEFPIHWDSQTHLGERVFWVDLAAIKQRDDFWAATYRRRCRRLFSDYLSTTNVPEDKHALAIQMLFELVDNTVSPDFPINVEIFDVTWRNRRTVAATRESIEGLERVRLDRLGLEEEEPCAICWRDYGQQEQLVTRLPCSHYYHEDCIVQWLQISHVCPMCRFAMPNEGVPST